MKMKKIIFLLILFVPFVVNGKSYFNYSDSLDVTDEYIVNFPRYKWYIDSNTKYGYNGNSFSTVDNFKKGGFLNESEFNISLHNGRSYLINGRYYWTMTSSGSYAKYVENDKIVSATNSNFSTGVRVTEYTLPSLTVTGKGTYADPWILVEPEFYVDITFDNPKIYRENVIQTDGIVEYGDIIEYVVKITNNGEYPANVVAREVELKDEFNRGTVTFTGAGNTTSQINFANQIMDEDGFEFNINGGQTLEYTFKVKVIGNAGQVIENLILYSIDGIDTKEDEKNKTPIEKQVSYNEIAENGANVILALDNSGSMRNPRLGALKAAVPVFTESLLGENANPNNRVCAVIMPCSYSETILYKCTNSKSELDTYLNGKLTAISGCLTPYSVTLDKSLDLVNELAAENRTYGNSIVLLSDGLPEGDVSSTAYQTSANKIKSNVPTVDFYTIGFNATTSAANLLKGIATTTDHYYSADNSDLSKIFDQVSKSISELTRRTTSGVFQISGEIDRSRKLLMEITHKDGSVKKIEKSFAQAINENYLISSGTKYEINIKMFEPDDKISVTYFLKVSK